MSGLFGHAIEIFREDSELALYRGHRLFGSRLIIAVAPRYGTRIGGGPRTVR